MQSRKRTRAKVTRRSTSSGQRTLPRPHISLDIENRLSNLEAAIASVQENQGTLPDEFETLQDALASLTDQVASLRTGVLGAADDEEATYNLDQIGRIVFCGFLPQLKARAFQIFAENPIAPTQNDAERELREGCLRMGVYQKTGVTGELTRKWFEEWKAQQMQEKQ